MDLSSLTLNTLEAMKRDALDLFNVDGATNERLVAAARLVAEVDHELGERIAYVIEMQAALSAIK